MVSPLNDKVLQKFSRVNRENLNEKVAAQIKLLILSKGIQKGQKLPPERKLTKYFGVSRVVVREALKSLEQSGLIEIRTGKTGGAFVVNHQYVPLFQVSYDLLCAGKLTLSHFYEMRMAVECSMVRLAVLRANDKDIARLNEINDQLINEDADPIDQGKNNDIFHLALADIVGNPLMTIMVEALLRFLRTVFTGWDQERTKNAMIDMHRRHKAIIEAIRSRNANLCEKHMAEDVEHTKKLAVKPRIPSAL